MVEHILRLPRVPTSMPIEEVPLVAVRVIVPAALAAPREPSKLKPVKPLLRDKEVNCEADGEKAPKLQPLGVVQVQALPVLMP